MPFGLLLPLIPPTAATPAVPSCATTSCTGEKLDGHTTGICTTSDGIEIYNPSYTQEDPTAWKECLAALNASGDPLHVVVRLNEPYTIQLEPTQIIAFAGANTVRSSIGNVEVTFKQDFHYERQLRLCDVIEYLQIPSPFCFHNALTMFRWSRRVFRP